MGAPMGTVMAMPMAIRSWKIIRIRMVTRMSTGTIMSMNMGTVIITIMRMSTEMIPTPHLLTLMQWLSPAYPVGGFSYSHGLEWAVAAGDVTDAAGFQEWLADILEYGTGRNDAILLAAAYRAPDTAALAHVDCRGAGACAVLGKVARDNCAGGGLRADDGGYLGHGPAGAVLSCCGGTRCGPDRRRAGACAAALPSRLCGEPDRCRHAACAAGPDRRASACWRR